MSEKQWKRLLDRTVNRDAGAEDFGRLEIYLDENCSRQTPSHTAATVSLGIEHRPLRDLIASFQKPAEPSKAERVLLWQTTFDRYTDLLAEGMTARAARRGLVAFLASHAPSLAKTEHALHVAFNAKLAKWQAGEGKPSALTDGRRAANEARCALVIGEEDRETLIAFAVKHGGGLSQGFREAVKCGALSEELTSRYIDTTASKSYVPRAIRNAIGNDVKLLDDLMHGPRQAQLGGAYIERDPSQMRSHAWLQGDDLTPPIYWFDPETRRVVRGQALGMVDFRSTMILGFVLITPEPDRPSTYSSWHIKNLITIVHDNYGLPREGFYFEQGHWKAKLLTGDRNDWTQTRLGLREFGVRFQHAKLPRAKVIERVFGTLQDWLESEPGYVGRGHQSEKYERVERAKQLVESGREPWEKHFYSREQWFERLTYWCDRFNEERQDGKYCKGLSPRATYEKYFGAEDDVVRLPDAARYLLANDKRKCGVRRNGISFVDGRERYTYKSAETGPLIGREVEVYFNRESPEILGVRHPDTGAVFAVRRATLVATMDAPPEILEQALSENAAHDSYKRSLYRAIKPRFSKGFLARPIFRPTFIDGATAEAGRQFAESAEAIKKDATTNRALNKRHAAAASQVGMQVTTGRRSEEIVKAAETVARLVAEAKQENPYS